MVAIPDNIRPHIDAVVRYHFWMLVPLVPLIVLPLVFLANGWLGTEMSSARSQIESRLSAVKGVAAIRPHPNAAWAADIDAATAAVKRQTLDAWQQFWKSQEPLRVWPASLGPDFVQKAAAARLDSKLSRKLLERYQNGVRAIVRELPARMGADESMVEPEGALPGGMQGGRNRASPDAKSRGSNALVVWNSADQQLLYESFDWEKPPTTPQVLLAQEEIWVYGLLCDSIKRMNSVAAGAYDAPIPQVEQLAVGYTAAEGDPGGARSNRILIPTASGPRDGAGGPPGGAAGGVGPRPSHPRFGRRATGEPAAPAPPPAEEGGAPPGAADDPLRNWIYVDFEGKPLSAGEVAASADARMVHLMPFVLRVVIDERRLDTLLVDLARSPVPIDVRQVRINAADGGGPRPADSRAAGVVPDSGARLHDISVELRGTVGLATPPDAKQLGIELPAEDGPAVEGEEQPGAEAAPAAAGQEFGRSESIG